MENQDASQKSILKKIKNWFEKQFSNYPYITLSIFALYMIYLYENGQVFYAVLYFSFIIFMLAVLVLFKKMDDEFERIWRMTIVAIIAFTVITYTASSFAKNLVPIEFYIGGIDAWIGFAGSILGGSITMLSLMFNLYHSKAERIHDEKLRLLPYVYIDWNIAEKDICDPNSPLRISNMSSNALINLKLVHSYFQGVDYYGSTVAMNPVPFLAPSVSLILPIKALQIRCITTPMVRQVIKCCLIFEYSDINNNKYWHEISFLGHYAVMPPNDFPSLKRNIHQSDVINVFHNSDKSIKEALSTIGDFKKVQ